MKKHFSRLDEWVRHQLNERGIDPDASCELLIAECRVMPPPKLLRDLGLAPMVEERAISGLQYGAGKHAA